LLYFTDLFHILNHQHFPPSTAKATKSFFHSFMEKNNELFDNIRLKVENPEAYPTIDVLEMQIMTALKHSSKGLDSEQQNSSLPKIFDETCKIQKNARMIVEEVFSFPDRYFTKGWLDDKQNCGQLLNKHETSANSEYNSSVAVAKSVIPTVTAKNKNEIDRLLLNEFLQSVVE
ncbi:MAG: hypothetical protein ACJ71H_19690, partial [Nitrososphaeraceae archaeon]